MTSMRALWRDFTWRRNDPTSPICTGRDNIPEWCAEASDKYEALYRAVRSKRPNGKMHNHQSKVSKALPLFERKLARRITLLTQCKSFNELYFMIETLKTPGIGPMTVYDVATRFGAYVGLAPEKIYIHAGTKAGLQALDIDIRDNVSIPMEVLPYPLRTRNPDAVEDFLCTYRLAFAKL
jgi:hypothetical protein